MVLEEEGERFVLSYKVYFVICTLWEVVLFFFFFLNWELLLLFITEIVEGLPSANNLMARLL